MFFLLGDVPPAGPTLPDWTTLPIQLGALGLLGYLVIWLTRWLPGAVTSFSNTQAGAVDRLGSKIAEAQSQAADRHAELIVALTTVCRAGSPPAHVPPPSLKGHRPA